MRFHINEIDYSGREEYLRQLFTSSFQQAEYKGCLVSFIALSCKNKKKETQSTNGMCLSHTIKRDSSTHEQINKRTQNRFLNISEYVCQVTTNLFRHIYTALPLTKTRYTLETVFHVKSGWHLGEYEMSTSFYNRYMRCFTDGKNKSKKCAPVKVKIERG